VVTELLNGGFPVRALVHRQDERSELLRRQGAEVVVADLCDVERVSEALKNVQRAYFCPPYDPFMIQGAVAFAIAAQQARLEHIVGMSQWLASPSHPSLMTRQSWLAERLFSMTPGITHTIVNPGFFADSYLVMMGLAAHLGVYPRLFGDTRNAPPSTEDIARVVVGAMKDPTRHAGKTYRPTGPKLLGAEDMAQIVARVVGRKIRLLPTPTWMFMKTARLAGLPIDLVSNLRYYIDDHRSGVFELGAPTSDVLDVTGRAPEDFETIAKRYALLPQNRRTFGNWVRQVAEFMITPLSPAYNLDRYDRELRRPFPSQSQLSVQSKVWHTEHGIAEVTNSTSSRRDQGRAASTAALQPNSQ
jgi:uncharacterized protein YbjT (DUF2867 family)